MRRFFIEKRNINKDNLVITGEEAHHIKYVIRLKPQDRFIGFDGEGFKYTCKISDIRKDQILAVIENKEKSNIKIPDVALACAIPKLSKMDYIIQKMAELRVKTLIPMVTTRTEVDFNQKKPKEKLHRWERIAKESSKQCGRSDILQILEPRKFNEVIDISNKYKIKLIPHITDRSKPIKDAIRELKPESLIVLIGPEGDFTSREITEAVSNDFVPVSLGQVVLRVDTAAIFTISVIMHELF